MSDTKLTFLGAGNIAQAIIGGLVENGFGAGNITAADPADEPLARLAESGVKTTHDNAVAAASADVIVISVKPDVVGKILGDIDAAGKLIVSVAAGITSDDIARGLGADAAIIRCMPNTPALVQTGMVGMYANARVSAAQKRLAESIVSAVGTFIWLDDESDMDAVTAVSGSGPAYFFYVMEAMEAAACNLGLPADVAHKLVTQTALGAAIMACDSEDSPGELRRKVTSPGGTTEAALKELQGRDLVEAFDTAIRAACERSKSLSQA